MKDDYFTLLVAACDFSSAVWAEVKSWVFGGVKEAAPEAEAEPEARTSH